MHEWIVMAWLLPKVRDASIALYTRTNATRHANMRLRLTVQRNGLPAANVVWSVPDTNSTQAYTVTRLLEDVNLIIPLEAEHWGLEHYVVEVGGFECLHFMPVAHALKEDDHVSYVLLHSASWSILTRRQHPPTHDCRSTRAHPHRP
jgi:hypothetical protein